MRGLFKNLIAPGLIMAAALSESVAGSTLAPIASPQPSESVAIPFSPPLNKPLFYRQIVDETRNGRPVHTRLELRVIFTRDRDGYVMTATYMLPPGMSPSHPAIAVLIRPLALRVSDEGEIIGIVDEPEYWSSLDSIVDGLANQIGGGDRQAAEVMRSMLTSMRDMPEASRLALVARNVSPLIEYSGTRMRVGEVLEGRVEGESPFGPIVQEVRTSLANLSETEARVQANYRLAPDQFDAILANLQRRFGRAIPRNDESLAEISVERRDTFRVSLNTGLTEQHESVVMAAGEIEGTPGQARRRVQLTRVAR